MPNVGPLEIAVVLVIFLVVYGPKRLPELGKSMGKGIHELKGSLSMADKHGRADTATGIRTPVSGLRIRRPSPLDDSGEGAAF
jgi:sec-independent protein translocase protein TatA